MIYIRVDPFLVKFPDPDFRVPKAFMLVPYSPLSNIFTLASKSGSHKPIKVSLNNLCNKNTNEFDFLEIDPP